MKKYRENKQVRSQFRFHLHAPKHIPRGYGKIIPTARHYHAKRDCYAVSATKNHDVIYYVEEFKQYIVRLGLPWKGQALSSSFESIRDAERAIMQCRAAHPK